MFLWKNRVSFWQDECLPLNVANVCYVTFVANSSIELSGTSTVYVGRKLSVLESGEPSPLFLNENWVTHWKI
jgi:hypothetical protein